MTTNIVTNNNSFKINQVVGSCALEGIIVPDDIKQKMTEIISGKTSLQSAKASILARYTKR